MSGRTRRGHVYRRRTLNGSWGQWHAVIDTQPVGAARKQVTRSFPTQTQAYAWLDSQRTTLDAGLTLGEYLPQWLAQQSHLAASTRHTCRGHIANHLIPVLGNRPVAQLTAHDVHHLHQTLTAWGHSPGLIHRVHATLSSALTAAVRDGLVDRNPAHGVTPPRRDVFIGTTWTLLQVRHFLATTRTDEWALLWRLAIITGLRRGELLGLRWCDVDLDAALVQVRFTRCLVGDRVVVGPPKTVRSRRALALDDTTVDMLRQMRVQAQEGALAGGSPLEVQQCLFVTSRGTPLPPARVSGRFKELIEAAGLPPIRFHDLRHISATLGLSHGESLKEVSARLGHSSVAVTGDVYTTVPDAVMRRSAQRLARIMALDTQPHRDTGVA